MASLSKIAESTNDPPLRTFFFYTEQSSAVMHLLKGNYYYFEAIHKGRELQNNNYEACMTVGIALQNTSSTHNDLE